MRAPIRHRFQLDPLFRRRAAFALLGLFTLLGWAGLVLSSSLLTIQRVEIEGGGKGISQIETTSAVFQLLDTRSAWRPWSPRHRWFVDIAALREGLKARWFAEDVQVERPAGKNIVRLIIREHPIALHVHTGDQYLEIDANGVVRRELTRDEQVHAAQRLTGTANIMATSTRVLEFPYLQDPVATGYRLGAPNSILRQAILLGNALEKTGIPFRAIVHQSEASPTLVVVHQNGIPAYIDTSISLQAQVEAWAEYLAARAAGTKGVEAAREFIDLRIPGRIYVK